MLIKCFVYYKMESSKKSSLVIFFNTKLLLIVELLIIDFGDNHLFQVKRIIGCSKSKTEEGTFVVNKNLTQGTSQTASSS